MRGSPGPSLQDLRRPGCLSAPACLTGRLLLRKNARPRGRAGPRTLGGRRGSTSRRLCSSCRARGRRLGRGPWKGRRGPGQRPALKTAALRLRGHPPSSSGPGSPCCKRVKAWLCPGSPSRPVNGLWPGRPPPPSHTPSLLRAGAGRGVGGRVGGQPRPPRPALLL